MNQVHFFPFQDRILNLLQPYAQAAWNNIPPLPRTRQEAKAAAYSTLSLPLRSIQFVGSHASPIKNFSGMARSVSPYFSSPFGPKDSINTYRSRILLLSLGINLVQAGLLPVYHFLLESIFTAFQEKFPPEVADIRFPYEAADTCPMDLADLLSSKSESSTLGIITLCSSFIVLSIFSSWLSKVNCGITGKLNASVARDITSGLTTHLFHRDAFVHAAEDTANCLSTDPSFFSDHFFYLVDHLIRTLTLSVAAVYSLYSMSPWLPLSIISLALAYNIVSRYLQDQYTAITPDIRKEEGRISNTAHSLNAQKYPIALLQKQETFKNELIEANDKLYSHRIRRLPKKQNLVFFEQAYSRIRPVVPFLVALPAFLARQIKLCQLNTIREYFYKISELLKWSTEHHDTIDSLENAFNRLEMIKKVLAHLPSTEVQISPPNAEQNTIHLETNLEIFLPQHYETDNSGITTRKQGEKPFLLADFELQPGTINYLLAPAGVGKSTLFKTLATHENSCIWPFACGTLTLNRDTTHFATAQPIVPPADLSLAQFLLGKDHKNGEKLEKLTNLFSKFQGPIARFSANLHYTPSTDELSWDDQLSAGQRQLINLLPIFLKEEGHKPNLLILDEAFSNIDADNVSILFDLFQEELDNPTILFTKHTDTGDIHQTNIRVDRILEIKTINNVNKVVDKED